MSEHISSPTYRNPALSASERMIDLMSRMTLEEKIGQMCQYCAPSHVQDIDERRRAENPDFDAFYPGLDATDIEALVREGRIGSFLHVFTAEETDHLQRVAADSRLGIPLLIGIDAIHGNGMVSGATVYPTPIGLACTWDPELVETVAEETAREVRATGGHWTFSPNVDVARDARWGRTGETFGEDTHLVSAMGTAMVRGYRGGDPEEYVLSCPKHLIAGSEPRNGLNAAPMDVSERRLRTVFLPPYRACIEEGAETVMMAHHDLNGTPCHANRWLMQTLMREEAGFEGFIVSDWCDVMALADTHRVAADHKEAVRRSVEAGLDMHMHGPEFFDLLLELVREGAVSESRVDDSVRRILLAKFRLGLFDMPVRTAEPATSVLFSEAHRATALEAARRSVVLLKNDGLLPVEDDVRHIVVSGPNAANARTLGDWALEQPADHVVTVLDGLRREAPADCDVMFEECGESVLHTTDEAIERVADRAGAADVAVLVVGENALRYDTDKTCGENVDRYDLGLPGRQEELVRRVVDTGVPTIVVLVNGRPLAIEWIAENVPAVVEAWEPGCRGGQAVAEILFGKVNPSGRLAMTIPRHVGLVHTSYDHLPSQYVRRYAVGEHEPLFPFGHGLSYTVFRYEHLQVPDSVRVGDDVVLSVEVTNTGGCAGAEVVQAFVNDRVSSVSTPVRALAAFERVDLAPGETRTVELRIAAGALALCNAEMKWGVEPGEFEVMVGDRSVVLTVTGEEA